MDPNLSPLDQLIAARIKVRFASHSRKADVNEYPEAIQSIKSADALVGGLKTVSTRSTALAREALNDFAAKVGEIPGKLEALGVDTKGVKGFHTQLSNLVKVAQKGHPLRAYCAVKELSTPMGKAGKVLVNLGAKALRSSGAGKALLKPALVQQYITKVVAPSLEAVRSACDDWREAVSDDCLKIESLVRDGGWISAEPFSSGFSTTPEYETYAKAQREFSKQSHDLTDLIRHNAIGLDLAPDGFEDCVDVDLCVNTIAKSVDELLKLHLEFGKKWGDYRAKLQAKWTGHKSLFARAT